MTIEPQLFYQRLAELTKLIDAHLERGSLDEGNATAFDRIIDAWLSDEIARLDDAMISSANAATAERAATDAQREAAEADRAAAEAEQRHRHARELAADARWQEITEAHDRARDEAKAARLAHHDARVRATKERLDAATRELAAARELLLGGSGSPASAPAPLDGPERRDEGTPFRHDEEQVA